jgi:uncharacterized protein YndB with AHSA1/START domain
MSVTSIEKDLERLTMTVTAHYDVSADRAWQLWSDPRQLERWWGPPSYPAAVLEHALVAGGTVTYLMTGPQGEQYHGYWEVVESNPPRHLLVRDGFADASGTPMDDMPQTLMTVGISDRDTGGVAMTITSQFPSLEAMEQLMAMGMDVGIREAVGQIDDILTGAPSR